MIRVLNKNILTFISFLALYLGIFGTVFAEPQPNPNELLQTLLEEPKIPYQGRLTLSISDGQKNHSDEAVVYWDSPTRYRWEYLSGDGHIKRLVVSDGKEEQVQLLHMGRTFKGDPIKSGARIMERERQEELIKNNYQLTTDNPESFIDRQVWVLEISPLNEGKPAQKFWIDQETHVVLKTSRYLKGNGIQVESQFTQFATNPEFRSDLFQPVNPGAGKVESHDLDPDFMSLPDLLKATGKSLKVSENTPEGFTFESGDFYRIQGHTILHLRYTDGLTVFSLFQTDRPVKQPVQRSVDDTNYKPSAGWLHLHGPLRVLHWKEKNHYYTLIGDVSQPMLERISAGFRAH